MVMKSYIFCHCALFEEATMNSVYPVRITVTLLAAFGFLMNGCVTKRVYHRAGLVPMAQPPAYTGAPIPARHEINMGSAILVSQSPQEGVEHIDTVTADGTEPLEYTKGNANWLPHAQFNLNWRIRLGERWTVGLMAEYGSDRGMVKTYTDTLDLKPKGPTWGTGLHLFRSFGVNPGFDIGLGFELMYYSIPFEKATLIDNGDGTLVLQSVESYRTGVALGSLSIIPTWRIGRAHVYAGLTFRNQPTVPKESQSVSNPLADLILLLVFPPALFIQSDDVEQGPVYSILNAGMDIPVADNTRFFLSVFYPLNTYPITYHPIIFMGFRWDSGARNTQAYKDGSLASAGASVLSGLAAF